jgi:two-component system, chemotaxis family, sensor kinase CheA
MSVKGLDKLRTLFAQEAEQRLGRLSQLVLELERNKTGDTADLIAEVFREVHTLKGSAAVVGFEDVGRYAHAIEERLGQLRSGAIAPTPAIIDALLVVTDRLGLMIWDSVGGKDADEPLSQAALARLETAFAPVPANDAPIGERQSDPTPVTPSPPAVRTAVATRPAGITPSANTTVMVPIERLDELVRMVGEAGAGHLRIGQMLSERLGVVADDVPEFVELSRLLNGLQERAMRTRMVPVSTITDSLQRAVRDAARTLGKDVRWEVRGERTELDRSVLHQLSDSLLHLVRNAVDHGIDSPEQRAKAGKPPQATVRLHAMQLGSEVTIAVSDDGGGIDLDLVRERATRSGIELEGLTDDEVLHIIFRSGFSTAKFVSDISGRGVGLDAVRSNVEAARGRVEVRSEPGVGSEFRIIVPITLAVLRCLVVDVGGQRFALPLHRVALVQSEDICSILHAEGRRVLQLDGLPIPISELSDVLDVSSTRTGPGTFVVVNANAGRHAFSVDRLVGQRDIVVKALSALMPRLEVIAGASVEPDGSVLLVLDPSGLIERSRQNTSRGSQADVEVVATRRRSGRLLVVDDALTVRELQRSILERAGFEVVVAGDGVDALAELDKSVFDLVLTDVEMPRMNGFTLTERIRAHRSQSNVGILILTSLASDEDRRRGMDAGADGYIVKSAFDEDGLLAAVDRLVGASV